MDKTRHLPTALALAAAVLLAACGPQSGADAGHAGATLELKPEPRVVAQKPAAPRADLGTVTAVTPIRSIEKPSGAGAVIGGVLGAAVGHQIGDGTGRKVATVVGAVGGAKVGHEIEKDRNTRITGYRIDIRFDDGRQTSITRSQAGAFATGQRVRMSHGEVLPA